MTAPPRRRQVREPLRGPAAERILLVTRKTRLDGLVARFNTRSQAKFWVERQGADFADYEREDEAYRAAVERLRRELGEELPLHEVDRSFLPNYLFSKKELVVTVGQDGLVVNTAKYLSGQPVVAVNPEPARFDGVLLPFQVHEAAAAVRWVLEGKAAARAITMAQARLNDGQRLLAFNDLFVGAKSHVSARYVISFQGRREVHSSSGLIVATGAGSSGWLSSLYNMARGMAPLLGEAEPPPSDPRFAWEEERLRFVVREPFESRWSQAALVTGEIVPGRELVLESRMPEEGTIFSDGIESDYLEFNAGAIASVGIAAQKTALVVGKTR